MRRMTRARRVAVLLVILAGVVPTIPASAGDLVLPPTETAAERIVDDYNDRNTLNNATLDIEGQAAIEAPPIKTIDDATFREYLGRGQTTLDDPFTVDEVEVFVPEQDSYPLVFVAFEEISAPDQEPVQQLLVFSQASADDGWKVTHAASFLPDADVPEVARDRNGLARIVEGSDSSLQVKPTKLGPKLARLWRRVADGAAISKPFEPGLLTTESIAVFLSELELLPINEANVELTFEPAESQPLCFAAEDDGALCFFVMSYTARLDPVSGVFEQPATREPLTGLVPPGEFGSVTFVRSAIVLAAVPKRARLGRVDLVGFYNGLISAETSPRGVDAPTDAV